MGQSFADGRYILAVRTPGLAASRRIGSILTTQAAQRVAGADVANLLNLGCGSSESRSMPTDRQLCSFADDPP